MPTETAPKPTNIFDAITSVGTGAITAWQQSRLQKMQEERAKLGLPPLDPAYFAPTVKVETSTETQTLINKTLKTVGFVAVGALGIYAISKILAAKKRA